MEGVPRDAGRARQLYEQAAAAGNVAAMHNLGVMLASGVDGQPDYRTAAIWFTRAAERGVRDSQYNLAVLYARGFGVAASPSEAWRWFALAAARGDGEAAAKRDEMAARLDARSLAAARQAVEHWAPLTVDAKANDTALADWSNGAPRQTASR
ncbi:sel1 repeat family protein [Starkeya koreensis]|uniref:Sel1 repeat family protein n=2 Tax=Ancylobacter koreensis TaxID=266121 RepID=A0ABT0DJ44_9HYPH|nr:sel1 repeat family protein [Ancylobacter koreensis]